MSVPSVEAAHNEDGWKRELGFICLRTKSHRARFVRERMTHRGSNVIQLFLRGKEPALAQVINLGWNQSRRRWSSEEGILVAGVSCTPFLLCEAGNLYRKRKEAA